MGYKRPTKKKMPINFYKVNAKNMEAKRQHNFHNKIRQFSDFFKSLSFKHTLSGSDEQVH